MRFEDLTPGNRGTFTLTPAFSNKHKAHVRDVERLINRKKKMYPGILSSLDIVQEGILFRWGPPEDFDSEEYEVNKP